MIIKWHLIFRKVNSVKCWKKKSNWIISIAVKGMLLYKSWRDTPCRKKNIISYSNDTHTYVKQVFFFLYNYYHLNLHIIIQNSNFGSKPKCISNQSIFKRKKANGLLFCRRMDRHDVTSHAVMTGREDAGVGGTVGSWTVRLMVVMVFD